MADDRRRLGRGLAALLGDVAEPDIQRSDRVAPGNGVRRVPIEFIRPNPRNPRKTFVDEDLTDLTNSIKEKGIFQPVLVRTSKSDSNQFEIIAGERRWRAAQRAGLHEVPVIVQEVSDKEALEIAIIENVQRADLNALEEAHGYEQLILEFSYTQQDLAQVIGKSRSHVANTLRLMKLPEKVKVLVGEGKLTAGHARALVGAEDPERLANRIVSEGLTVRDAEALAQAPKPVDASKGGRPKREKDADTQALEKSLTDLLGLAVVIDHKDGGAGEIKVRYRNLEQLDEIVRRLRTP